jgi:hypothetical protein
MNAELNYEPDDDLPRTLGQPARRALAAAGIRNLMHLTGFQEGGIRRLHGIGPQALTQLTQALAERGLMITPEHKEQTT